NPDGLPIQSSPFSIGMQTSAPKGRVKVAWHGSAINSNEIVKSGFLAGRLTKKATMRITIGSDHAGFELKQVLAGHLKQNDHQVVDVGTHNIQAVDYHDYAEALAMMVVRDDIVCVIMICGR